MPHQKHHLHAAALLVAVCLTAGFGATAAQLANNKVDVDLFVMSQCPDAIFCESYLAPLLEDMKYHINLNFHFIGDKQADGSWKCRHGDDECAGNLQQLCVQQFSPEFNRVNWLLNFILCNNKAGVEETGKFATAAKCLKEVGAPVVEGTQMMACMYSPGRQSVLNADFAQTAALGVTTSCTVQYEANTVCVRDGGKWKDCPAGSSVKELKDLLCASYAAKNEGRMPTTCQAPSPTRSTAGRIALPGGARVAVA